MKKYYIIRPDGSSIFKQPYPLDFCLHCLVRLLDVSDVRFNLLCLNDTSEIIKKLSSCSDASQYGALYLGAFQSFLGSVSALEC